MTTIPDGDKWSKRTAEYHYFARPYHEAARKFKGLPVLEAVEGSAMTMQVLSIRWHEHKDKMEDAIARGRRPPPPPLPPTPAEIVSTVKEVIERLKSRR